VRSASNPMFRIDRSRSGSGHCRPTINLERLSACRLMIVAVAQEPRFADGTVAG
jgi:hypothetical protein